MCARRKYAANATTTMRMARERRVDVTRRLPQWVSIGYSKKGLRIAKLELAAHPTISLWTIMRSGMR
jgi:hypothetical protein